MIFIRLSDHSFPHGVFDIINACKPTILPSEVSLWDLPSLGFAEIVEGARPPFDPITQEVVSSAVEQLSGIWTQAYEVRELPTDQAEANLSAAIQQAQYDIDNNIAMFLDGVARDRGGYASIESAALRAAWPGRYQEQGRAFGQWLDACRDHCKVVMLAVRARTRPIPSFEEVIAELPQLALPAVQPE